MDAPVVQNLKLQILILLVTQENIRIILSELMVGGGCCQAIVR